MFLFETNLILKIMFILNFRFKSKTYTEWMYPDICFCLVFLNDQLYLGISKIFVYFLNKYILYIYLMLMKAALI